MSGFSTDRTATTTPPAISSTSTPATGRQGVEDEPGLAVDRPATVGVSAIRDHARAPADERLRDAQGADERDRDRRRLPAAVPVERHVRRQNLDERVRVAVLPGVEESAGHLVPLLARHVEPLPSLLHVRVGAHEDLPAVGRRLADDARHLVVRVVEDLAEEEDGPLDRRELLEQVQERQRERICRLGVHGGLVVDDRLRQPLPRVHLPTRACGAQLVDREPRRHRCEVRLGRVRVDLGLLIAEERLLDHVLGVRDRADIR